MSVVQQSSSRVSAIVLAAGESRRMGRAKQILPFGDSTILGTVLAALAASEVDGVTVVLGRNWQEVYPTIESLDVEVVVNPRPERGMLSSAQWGLGQLRDDADSFLFVLGDQPQIQQETVDRLIQRAGESERGIALPTHGGRRGHPLLVDARHKRAILALPLSGGLNQLLEAHPGDIEEVPVESASVLIDIDTPEEYEEAMRRNAR